MAWGDLENEMSDVLSGEFAEAVRHVPMARSGVNARPAADADRAAYETKGIFDWGYLKIELNKGHDKARAAPMAHHATRNPTLSIDVRDFTQDVRRGDRFVLIDRAGDLTFEVSSVEPDGQGRIILQLNQCGRADLMAP